MSVSRSSTSPEEFLKWIGPWALDKAEKVIAQTGEFGRPMLFGLSEDGTHHVSMLAFWSYDDHEGSMNLLRKVLKSSKMVAIALLSRGRVKHTDGQLAVDGMALIKSIRGGSSSMEFYLPKESSTISFADEPSEVMEEISGRLTDFWDFHGDNKKDNL